MDGKSTESSCHRQDGVGKLSECDVSPRRFRHPRDEPFEGRRCPPHRALNAGSGPHGDDRQTSSITWQPKSSMATEKTLPQESFISKVPLRLQIKVSCQRGSLGISIAGGKGSLPYKEHDEGIFISRVNKGGSSEKAGIHVGDRLLEVNGLDMQAATHQEAVNALRNAGSCIQMKVLREGLLPREVYDHDRPHHPLDVVVGQQPCSRDGVGLMCKQQLKRESAEECLSKKIETVLCNGNGISVIESDLSRTLSKLEGEDAMTTDSLEVGKHTMTIPRIILTHPSTSDEDVELLTQSPSREPLHDIEIPDAFYPP